MAGGTRLIDPLSAWLLPYALKRDVTDASQQALQALRQHASAGAMEQARLPAHALSEGQILALITEIRHKLLPYLLMMGVLEPAPDYIPKR